MEVPGKVVKVKDVKPEPVTEGGAKGVTVRWLISEKDGAPNFSMRYFEVEPGGKTPEHSHPWEHEMFILEGEGEVVIGNEKYRLAPFTAVYVPPNELHYVVNTSKDQVLKLLCLIPHTKR